jgi:hypothetical protein
MLKATCSPTTTALPTLNLWTVGDAKEFISVNVFRKSAGPHKMDSFKKRTPDYTDIAYREAVARLRYLLAESYSPRSSPTKGSQVNV